MAQYSYSHIASYIYFALISLSHSLNHSSAGPLTLHTAIIAFPFQSISNFSALHLAWVTLKNDYLKIIAFLSQRICAKPKIIHKLKQRRIFNCAPNGERRGWVCERWGSLSCWHFFFFRFVYAASFCFRAFEFWVFGGTAGRAHYML